MLQLIKDLHDNAMCAMQAGKGRQGSWLQVSKGFKQGDVNAPLFSMSSWTASADTVSPKLASWASDWPTILMAILPAVEGQTVVCPCWILLYPDDMVIFEKSCEQMRAALAVVHQALED